MATVKFGTNQLSNPTPSWINRCVRVFTVTAGVFLTWMSASSLIGPHSKDAINQLLGLALLLTNALAPMFGIELNNDESVPVSQVTAMEDDTKK